MCITAYYIGSKMFYVHAQMSEHAQYVPLFNVHAYWLGGSEHAHWWVLFLAHWPYKGQWAYSIINISFNLWTDFVWSVSTCLCVSLCVSTCLCVAPHVSMCLSVSPHVSVCLHVWFVWSVSVSPCGYGHGVSPCLYHIDIFCWPLGSRA